MVLERAEFARFRVVRTQPLFDTRTVHVADTSSAVARRQQLPAGARTVTDAADGDDVADSDTVYKNNKVGKPCNAADARHF